MHDLGTLYNTLTATFLPDMYLSTTHPSIPVPSTRLRILLHNLKKKTCVPPILRLLIFGKFRASNTVTDSLLDRG